MVSFQHWQHQLQNDSLRLAAGRHGMVRYGIVWYAMRFYGIVLKGATVNMGLFVSSGMVYNVARVSLA